MMRKSTYEPSKFASSTSIRSIGERRKAIEAVPEIAVPKRPVPKIEDHDDKDTRKIKSMFKINSNFRNAVKLVTQKTLSRRQNVDFGREIQTHKIIPNDFLKVVEQKTIATLATGYSYAIDIEDEMMNSFMKNQKMDNDTLMSTQRAVISIYAMDTIQLKKVFTFSVGDYSEIYNISEIKTFDNVINKLIEVSKFSNAKRQHKLETFKQKNFEAIQELTDENHYNEMYRLEDRYA